VSDALWSTPFGQLLLVKQTRLAIVFAMMVINRFGLTERAQLGDPAAGHLLRRSIITEIALFLSFPVSLPRSDSCPPGGARPLHWCSDWD